MRRPPRDPGAGIFSGGLGIHVLWVGAIIGAVALLCLLYTSDAADERSSVDLGGRRIIKKKTNRRPNM